MSLVKIAIYGLSEDEHKNIYLRDAATFEDADVEICANNWRGCNVILSFGELPEELMKLPYEFRKRWLHFKDFDKDTDYAKLALECFLANLHRKNQIPLVSVCVPLFNTSERYFLRLFNSIVNQTYSNWELILLDDSSDNNTYSIIENIIKDEPRARLFKFNKRSGKIGETKYNCFYLASGNILVEMDHDDELTHNALDEVVRAFLDNPEAGFVGTDFAEVYESGENKIYPEGFAFGYGKYRREVYNSKIYEVYENPELNRTTIQHLVGLPNHLRCWKKDFYFSIGGHSRDLDVADDYDLLIRTFLNTQMIMIKKLCYIQYFSNSNTQLVKNKKIQTYCRFLYEHYKEEIEKKFKKMEKLINE